MGYAIHAHKKPSTYPYSSEILDLGQNFQAKNYRGIQVTETRGAQIAL